VAASKQLVDHALSCFSTDNLSCMIVRFDREALVQSHSNNEANAADSSANEQAKVSEADKIVQETKEKIAAGDAPALGVSASNSGRGHDPVTVEDGDFVPTTLDGSVAEETAIVDDEPAEAPGPEKKTT
jgi:protein phosphatase PTC1